MFKIHIDNLVFAAADFYNKVQLPVEKTLVLATNHG